MVKATSNIEEAKQQLSAALAHGYSSAALAVSLRHARKLNPPAFNKHNLVVLGVDSKAQIHQVYPRLWGVYPNGATFKGEQPIKSKR